jgi:exoribonuclease-2
MARGAKVRVQLGRIDAIALDVHGTVLERLDTPTPAEVTGMAQDAFDEDDDDDAAAAGPLNIAVDLSESPLEPAA